MLRSPFFYFFIFVFLLSCQEEGTEELKLSSTQKEVTLFRKKGLAELKKDNFDEAFYNFNKSKIIAESLRDSVNFVYNLIQMASIQQINGDYYGSKETLTDALPYVKKKDIYIASINNYFGIADKELSLYNDAIINYKQAIKDCTDEISKLYPLNNIAVVYIHQKKYNKAIAILESLVRNPLLNQKSMITHKARIFDNLGYAYFKNGYSERGLALLNKGYALRDQNRDFYGSIESNLHLAEYYSKVNSKKSIDYAKTAYQIATKFNSIDERLRALSFLISTDLSSKNMQYSQKYILLNDSIIKIRNNYKNKFAKIKYDSKKEKDENQQLRLEKSENLVSLQTAKYQQILFLVGIIILFLALIYFRKSHHHKTKIIKIKTAYDTETRIAQDIHDELANDVFHAMTFIQTQSLTNEAIKQTLIEKLDAIYTRVRGISRENSEIDTGVNYTKRIKEMIATYNDSSRNVIVNNIEKVNWELFDATKKVTLYRVLQELMINMKKHSQASLIVVKFDLSNPKSLLITYSDNGKGCIQEEITKNGLQNMENRILAVNGIIIFDTAPEKGFKVKITLPK